jgi:hypothetical protein
MYLNINLDLSKEKYLNRMLMVQQILHPHHQQLMMMMIVFLMLVQMMKKFNQVISLEMKIMIKQIMKIMIL